MNWIDAALFGGALLGLALGGVLIARSPTFWFEVGTLAFVKLSPVLMAYFSKRLKPEDEEKFHRAVRQAHEWDNLNKRPRDK